MIRISAAALSVTLATAMIQAADAPTKQWVYIGTYTGAKSNSNGIYRFEFDAATGQLTPAGLMAEATNPSFLAIHPTGKYLLAVGESQGGAVFSYRIDPKTGQLTKISQQPSGGNGPCHVAISHDGKFAFVANYGSGSAAAFRISDSGELSGPTAVIQHRGSGPNKARQSGPHAHSVTLDPSGLFAMVADLGVDKIYSYRLNDNPGLTEAGSVSYSTAPGAGPRHFAFHPDGKQAFVINELNSTLSRLHYHPDAGSLTEKTTVSTVPADFKGSNSTAEVVVHPNGKFVYGSNRGHNSIAAFAIDPSGELPLVGHQSQGIKTPRNFNIDPTGQWMIVANQHGNDLLVFKIDQQTGALVPTGNKAEVGSPVCVKLMRAPMS